MNETNLCNLCSHNTSKYTCPKCNVHYCSMECYRSEKHLQCSENFYRECVVDEMHLNKNNEGSTSKMMEILQKFHDEHNSDNELKFHDEHNSDNELDSDDECCADLEERFKNIDLDNVDEVWGKLTADEKQEFETIIKSGDVTKLVPLWTPWWCFRKKDTLIEDLENIEQVNYADDCPPITENIKPFTEISNKKPADTVIYNVINVLSAYSCVVRYFNGDHHEFLKEFVYLLHELSKNLSLNENFLNYTESVESVHQQSLNGVITADKSLIYEDTHKILNGPESANNTFYIKCALSDVHSLLHKAKKPTNKTKANEFSKRFFDVEIPDEKVISKSRINLTIKKLEYFLSFISMYTGEFS